MRLSRIATAVCILIALFVPVHAFPQEKFVTFWHLSEHPPDIIQGGRANSIAIHPQNRDEMLVASDTGGLFKSTDGGLHWTHVDSLPVMFTQSVVYLPANPGVILVSAKIDFKTNSGGGVWRSEDGGDTWDQAELVAPPWWNGPLSGYGISALGNDVVVGTTYGVFVSRNGGLDWTHSHVFDNGSTVYSVLLTRGEPGVPNDPLRIYAGGWGGVRLGTLPLSDWVSPILDPGANGGVMDMHAFSDAPLGWNRAFVVNGAGQLFRTEDRGNIWTLIPSAPAGAGYCRGTRFIRQRYVITYPDRFLHLYYGNRCGVYRFVALADGTTVHYDAGTWEQLDVDHGGPRDLVVAPTGPALLATNGGLHNTADQGDTWRFVGGGRDGYNALQVTEIRGQFVGGSLDLYFGTRDNGLWATNVWGNGPASRPSEGFHIEAERNVPTSAESQITYTACGPCRARVSGRRFDGDADWPNAPGGSAAPVFLRRDHYVQNVQATPALQAGLALTESSGMPWKQYGSFPEEPRGIPRLARAGAGDHSIVYQAFRSNLTGPPWEGATRLLRVHYSQGNGIVVYPAHAGFGGLGSNHAVASYPVYGVDTRNAFHVIAPDFINEKVMETWDGGESWTEIPGLTSLVTDNGRLRFRLRTNEGGWGREWPLVTAVSFGPNPSLVLIGTSEGGIYFSADRGETWRKLAGTERATNITSFFWQNENTVFVSTFGRGLWKLRNVRIAVPDAFDDLCALCEVVSNDGAPGRPPFDGSVLVFDGRILGVRTDGGRLREVFVTPASSVVFTGDQKDPQEDIVITASDGTDEKFEPLPEPPDGWLVTGVVFTTDDELTGTAFAKSELTLIPPETEVKLEGSTESPTKGAPYIRLTSESFSGVPTVGPEESFELSGTDFLAGASYEVLIDGVPIKGTVTADGSGSFTTRINAPSEHGHHGVAVRTAGAEAVIDGSTIFVRDEN